MRGKNGPRLVILASALIVGFGLVINSPTKADFLTIYGGPTYNSSTGNGFIQPTIAAVPGSSASSGVGIGWATKEISQSGYVTPVRWDRFGNIMELGSLGVDDTGHARGRAYAINSGGSSVGLSEKYDNVLHSDQGPRAVRWDAAGNVTELGNLYSQQFTNYAGSTAYAINASGQAVGGTIKYDGYDDSGTRAVRWDASGNATELGNLGTTLAGTFNDIVFTESEAHAINDSGTAIGFADKYVDTFSHGTRAVRWDASTSVATELGTIAKLQGTDYTLSAANAINNSGTAVGWSERWNGSNDGGHRAVRWDASGTAATELGNLGADMASEAYSINNAGVAVGYAGAVFNNTYMGDRATRWDPSGAAVQLGSLGNYASIVAYSYAFAINDSGQAAGYSQTFDKFGIQTGVVAVTWGPDGKAIDLNSLISPTSGWHLTDAFGISADNWITGVGYFDPDGAGPLPSYERLFLIQVPEPVSGLLIVGAILFLPARRASRRCSS